MGNRTNIEKSLIMTEILTSDGKHYQSRAHQLANQFIQATEETDLDRLNHEAMRAHDRAQGCGCHSCLARAEAAQNSYAEEAWRVNVWQPDQEEEALAQFALASVKALTDE